MRIEAQYFDGFTTRLLSWKLEVNNGKAYLEAGWFRSSNPLKAKFRFDESAFREALPFLSSLNEAYEAPCEDQESRSLILKDGEVTIRRSVYGAWFLIDEFPEIEHFLTVWRMIETAVMAQLPDEIKSDSH
jgi:hypothetical protein